MYVKLWNIGKQAQADHSQKQLWIALSIIHQSCTDTREWQSASGTAYMHVWYSVLWNSMFFMLTRALFLEREREGIGKDPDIGNIQCLNWSIGALSHVKTRTS